MKKDSNFVPAVEWPFEEVQSEEYDRELQTEQVYVTDVEPRQTIVSVSKYAPVSRDQYEAWKHLWPMTYREDTRQNPKFTTEEISSIKEHMNELLASKQVRARIVDPSSNTVLSEAPDTRTDGHPLHHAVMNCIDLISQREREQHGDGGRPKRKAAAMMNEGEKGENSATGYLCTGYDIFITHEPCAM
ncbi:uncharacterized protein BYT42DRAFT_549387 [Radiomyces spectabilis]|uniref:uncharacterized protein n=1 Tax=Radiomyces spectabilis TaxID=64574 RepID=UPI00221F2ED4|nr:uncharacterized protein BYT42DRAFT_549387 [Radiomyces spectabilis]KAI8368191.1 hypothetical protein BYT42DRAFT_549387 [Radiomyces spectabilis]